jgi:hypothetical protein
MCTGCAGHRHHPVAATTHLNPRSVLSFCSCIRQLTLLLLDYVLQLRKHIRQGLPANSDEEQAQYIDLVGHWQDQCTKLREENQRLRSVNIKLERSLQQLSHSRTSTPDDCRPSAASASFASKRKAPASTTRRKAPVVTTAEQSTAQTQEGFESDYGFLEGLGEGKSPNPSLPSGYGQIISAIKRAHANIYPPQQMGRDFKSLCTLFTSFVELLAPMLGQSVIAWSKPLRPYQRSFG